MLRNILTLAAGTTLAQIIYVLSTPVLTRLYGPEDFGVLALILAVSATIAPFATLRYDAAILLKDDEVPPGTLLVLGFAGLFAVTLVFAQMSDYAGRLLLSGDIAYTEDVGAVTASYVFFLGANAMLTSWHTRYRRFKVVSGGRIVQALATVVVQIVAAASFGMWGLIYGHLFGLVVFAVISTLLMFWWDGVSLINGRLLRHLRAAVIKYKNFPLYSTWSTLLNGLVNNLPNILFVKLFSPAIAGHFAVATRVIRTPLSVIGQSIYHVTAQHAGEHLDDRAKISAGLDLVLPKMAHLAILPFVVMGIFMVPVIEFVLGEQWREAGEYGRTLLPWLFLIYMTWPLTGVYNALNYQRALLGFNALFLVGVLVSFSVVSFGFGVDEVLIMLAFTGGLTRLAYAQWILVRLQKELSKKIVVLMGMYAVLIAISAA